MNELQELVVYGKRISQDRDGYISLTDLWRVAGRVDHKQPKYWQRIHLIRELISALSKKVSVDHLNEQSSTKPMIYTTRGRDGSTYAHVILALAYAEYLNPEIGIEVRDIALRYWSGDVSLLDHIARTRHEQHEEDTTRLATRGELRWYNQIIQYLLRDLGARTPGDFGGFYNAGYQGLYNGEIENDIHRRKGLHKDQSIQDYMTSDELAPNLFTRSQARLRIEHEVKFATWPPTVQEATKIHYNTGKFVRRMMKAMKTPMPEDMPTADSISDAKCRITAYRKGLKKKVIPGT